MHARAVCSVAIANLFVLMLCFQMVSSQLPADQVSSMTSVYEIIQNDTASYFVWYDVLKNSSPCSWEGVVCSPDNSSIINLSFNYFFISTSEFLPFVCNISTLESLDVSSNLLSSIPDGFYTGCGVISGLKLLNFSENELKGSLPSFIGFTVLENLDFSRNSLSGEISEQFKGLGSLKSLNLGWNAFGGKIPTNLGKLNLLEELVLSANNFSGKIPVEISKYRKLRVVDLSDNMLSGSIPEEFGKLTRLETLVLSLNNMSGEIPTSLSNITTLRRFVANRNWFSGSIPPGITSHLEYLDLSYNELTGTIPSGGEIPAEITKYRNLRVVDLSYNMLSGLIPEEFGELTRLETLDISNNYLSGAIPPPLFNITALRILAANQNRLNGSIPPGITSHLEYLNLSSNELTGSIPSDLLSGLNLLSLDLTSNKLEGRIPGINSTKMFRLRLGSNSFNGTIPSTSLETLQELMYLELDNNSLSGGIPLELGMLRQLVLLNLAQNRLTGMLPPELGNLTNLYDLSLQSNNFVGVIPPEISQLIKLERLNISNNSLNGSIPLSISRMQSIRNLDLQRNRLHGPIPNCIGDMNSLIELQLGSNQLSGRIPTMPFPLQIALNLSHNLFDGPIPFTLATLGDLEVLDLSNNRFSGKIPDYLTGLGSLTHLILMNNELSGVVPKFATHVLLNTTGNNLLIYPEENPSSSRENPSPTPQRKKISTGSDLVIAVASGIPVGLLIYVIAIFVSRRYNRIHGYLSPPNSIQSSTIDFKRAMEAVADPSNITLNTTFSTFYKAVMPSGTTYLVKKVNHTNKTLQFPRHKELVEELELLGNLSHANVMIPKAYVLTVHKAYLCYDFVRGTLHDILHHRRGITLAWESHYNIAVGVAKGLAYLHECTSGPIILLDLCSKSILLKSLDEPQISDIELCRMIQPSDSQGIGANAKAPPEYGNTKRATAAGNVYSFGVVLLELLTGKPAVSGESEVAKCMLSSSNQKQKWHEILDSSETSSVGVRNQMFAVFEVALACITTSPEMRPNSVTVLQMLQYNSSVEDC